jgi:hypothetical protein
MPRAVEITPFVMAWLDPAIQGKRPACQLALDPRVKPAGDGEAG